MAPVPSVVASALLVAAGAVLALAGRHLYESLIKLVGFAVGFGAVVVGGGAGQVLVGGGAGGDPNLGPAILAVGVVVGLFTMSLAWLAYVLAVIAPGVVGGGAVGLAVVAPPQGAEWGLVVLLAAAGAAVAWKLHQFVLVVLTSASGGVLIGLGVTGHSVWSLPFVRRPRLVLEDPAVVIDGVVGLLQSLLAVVVVVTVVGVVVQLQASAGEQETTE